MSETTVDQVNYDQSGAQIHNDNYHQYQQQGNQNLQNNSSVQFSQEFVGTPAANFNGINALANGYNNLHRAFSTRIDNLPEEDRQMLLSHLSGGEFGAPESPEMYQLNLENAGGDAGINAAVEDIAYGLSLSTEQAVEFAEFIDGYQDGIVQMQEQEANAVVEEYTNDSVNYFGENLEGVIRSADHAFQNVLPYITGWSGEDIVDLFDRHGLSTHPVVLAMCAEIGEWYQSGRSSVPVGSYGSRGSGGDFYNTPEVRKILANPHHPQYKDMVHGLKMAKGMR